MQSLIALRRQGEEAWRAQRVAQKLVALNLPLLAKLCVRPAESVRSTLSPADATQLRLSLEALGVVFVKLGQILSTRSDLLPEVLCEELRHLQTHAGAVPAPAIEQCLRAAFGSPPWDTFYTEPLASASMGQCHAAEVAGTAVVVKVRRPGVTETVQTDLRIFCYIASTLEQYFDDVHALQIGELCAEMSRSLEQECDFTFEKRALERFSALLGESVKIPRPVEGLCSPSVLTMTYVPGRPLLDAAEYLSPDARRACFATLMRSLFSMLFRSEDGTYHADMHPGNLLVDQKGGLGIIDFGLLGYVSDTQRTQLLALCVALATGRTRVAAEIFLSMCSTDGARLDPGSRRQLLATAESIFTCICQSQLRGSDTSAHTLALLQTCQLCGVRLPSGYGMLFKSFCTVEGIGRSMCPDFDVISCIRPILMRAAFGYLWTPARTLRSASEVVAKLLPSPQSKEAVGPLAAARPLPPAPGTANANAHRPRRAIPWAPVLFAAAVYLAFSWGEASRPAAQA
jgi:ubiquinone biosynthesis protein